MRDPKENARQAPGARSESTSTSNDGPTGDGLQQMMDCPRWDHCGAPVCPLYAPGAVHLEGESVCLYLRELYKSGGRARLRASIPGWLFEVVDEAAPRILDQHSPIRRAVKRASRTPSKLRRPGAMGAT